MNNACPRCGRPMRSLRSALHLKGECQTRWYRRLCEQRGGPLPAHTREPKKRGYAARPDDLTPEQIERIMHRRAAEQRYERALRS